MSSYFDPPQGLSSYFDNDIQQEQQQQKHKLNNNNINNNNNDDNNNDNDNDIKQQQKHKLNNDNNNDIQQQEMSISMDDAQCRQDIITPNDNDDDNVDDNNDYDWNVEYKQHDNDNNNNNDYDWNVQYNMVTSLHYCWINIGQTYGKLFSMYAWDIMQINKICMPWIKFRQNKFKHVKLWQGCYKGILLNDANNASIFAQFQHVIGMPVVKLEWYVTESCNILKSSTFPFVTKSKFVAVFVSPGNTIFLYVCNQ